MKPSDLYSKLIEDGLLSFDSEQSQLLNKLDQLSFDLVKRSKAWFGQKKIKGLYIRGEVGRGKTQMMDIFFQALQVKNKKRIHFHRFMKLLHEDLDKISGQKDPLKIAAKNISKQTEVLCFDEFYQTQDQGCVRYCTEKMCDWESRGTVDDDCNEICSKSYMAGKASCDGG